MMTWFGTSWGARICDPLFRVDPPIGKSCLWCEEPIVAGESGVLIPHVADGTVTDQPWHLECFLRSILGGINHQRGRCTCCGGDQPPDPPGLTKREAARLAAGGIV